MKILEFRILQIMRYTPQQYVKALLELVAETPKYKHREVMREFLRTLSAHGAFPMLHDIVREVGEQIDAEKNVKRVSVRTVERESEASMRRKLHFKAAVSVIKDVRLGGGAIVEMGDLRVDNSIAMRVGRLRKALLH